jgi:integrase
MARTMRDAKLQTRAARARLQPQRKPHWCTLRPGVLHLGYCRPRLAKPGHWAVRRYLGSPAAAGVRGGRTPYKVARLPGVADDFEDADGVSVLSFSQALDLALAPPDSQMQLGPLTVEQAGTHYVTFLRDSGRERAATEAAQRIKRHVLPQLGAVQVAALTPEQLRGWLAALARKLANGTDEEEAVRRSRVTANRILATFRAALNHAYAEEKVPSDAAWRRRLVPFKNVEVSRKRYLTIEEARRLINAAQGAFRHLVQAALHTGARYSELARLKVHDFDPDSGTIAIGKSKSSKPRRVHLTEEGETFFQDLTTGRNRDALMLPRAGQDKPWRHTDQRWHMNRAIAAASISPRISFHGLRHTYASLSLMGGVPLQVVAENLGHADTRMCERHYGHLAASHKRDAIRAGAPRFGVAQESTNVKALKPPRR